jgi:hypothetical protein
VQNLKQKKRFWVAGIFFFAQISCLLNVVSRAINLIAQDKDHIVDVCVLVDVKLELLERATASDARNLNFDSTSIDLTINFAKLRKVFWICLCNVQ